MINKAHIKAKSEELNIPFANVLSGVICETVVQLFAESSFGETMMLCNGEELGLSCYKDSQPRRLFYTYCGEEVDLMKHVFPKAMKLFIDKASAEGLKIGGQFEQYGMLLTVTVDQMYIPLQIFIDKNASKSIVPVEESLKLTLSNNKQIKYLAYPKEQVLATHLFEIVEKLELINDMDPYYQAYNIITKYPVNGRKVKDALGALCQDGGIEISEQRLKLLESYSSYSYMKKKWKVLLRQKKKSEPEWTDLNQCLLLFLRPIWKSLENNTVFLGDWMPQLKRYLD